MDVAADNGEHARFFVRRDLASRWSAEGGGGFGRLTGDRFATDVGLVDLKLLFLPLRFPAWRVYAGAGIGLAAHSIERAPTTPTAGFDREGWSATFPSSLGLQFRLRNSLALEVAGSYAYTLRDDLEGVAIEKGNDGFWSASVGLVIGDFGNPSAPALPVRRFTPGPCEVRDRDGDGLSDHQETRQYFTNPLMADSDCDGADDFAEVRDGTDPNRMEAARAQDGPQ